MAIEIKESKVFLALALAFSIFYIGINVGIIWTAFYALALMLAVWMFREKEELPNYCEKCGKKIKY